MLRDVKTNIYLFILFSLIVIGFSVIKYAGAESWIKNEPNAQSLVSQTTPKPLPQTSSATEVKAATDEAAEAEDPSNVWLWVFGLAIVFVIISAPLFAIARIINNKADQD